MKREWPNDALVARLRGGGVAAGRGIASRRPRVSSPRNRATVQLRNPTALISAIVLAAGQATRFGQCKQVLRIRGKTILDHALDNLRGSKSGATGRRHGAAG